jgi:hypothetical protein
VFRFVLQRHGSCIYVASSCVGAVITYASLTVFSALSSSSVYIGLVRRFKAEILVCSEEKEKEIINGLHCGRKCNVWMKSCVRK